MKKGPNCPTVLPSPEAVFTWLIFPDRMPLDGKPRELGRVKAPDIVAARKLAAEQWPGVAVIVLSALSAQARALSAPVDVKQPHNAKVSPRKARGREQSHRSKQRYRDFAAEKRAAHAVTKRDINSRTDR